MAFLSARIAKCGSLEEMAKGFFGRWKNRRWQRAEISARDRARMRKETLILGGEWPFERPRKEMRPKMKGHKCDRIAAEKRARTEELMKKMPQMLFEMKKRTWQRRLKDKLVETSDNQSD